MKHCPDNHTVAPDNYVAWHEWAEKKSKTHEQVQCPECKEWAIWQKHKEEITKNDGA